ncbi:MAG TPA: phospholipase D family protein, partial [Polyangiales bacterium]|nr:phospholipase D family protein [Polyangiales bacterium]
ADYLALDFTRTFSGKPQASQAVFEGAQVLSLSGAGNDALFATLIARIDAARERIDVVSPYLTFPFCETLAAARARGVRVRLFTPQANNKGVIRDYLLWTAKRYGFEVCLYDRMSHMKAMLIDERVLVVGSSNFDFVSYHAQAELVALLDDPEIVSAFRTQVLEPDAASSTPAGESNELRGRIAYAALKIAEAAARASGALLRADLERQGS